MKDKKWFEEDKYQKYGVIAELNEKPPVIKPKPIKITGQYKLQEIFWEMILSGKKSYEFKKLKLIKKWPEILNGAIYVEVVSPDYEHIKPLRGKQLFNKKCNKCPHGEIVGEYSGRDGHIGNNYFCKKINKRIASDGYGFYFSSEFKSNMCPLNKEIKQGKKLGTMKLELNLVDEFGFVKQDYYDKNYYSINTRMSKYHYQISEEEFDFLKDNKYYGRNDFAVILKISEVKSYADN